MAPESQPRLVGDPDNEDVILLGGEEAQDRFSTIVVLFACLSPSLDCELLRDRGYVCTCLALCPQ